jgi:restriction endonuclease S subunit
MQYSIVNYKKLNLRDRVDAEYFQPTYLHIEDELKKQDAQRLEKFCDITGSAFYPAATQLYEIGEIPFIRCVDCISFPIITTLQNNSFERIPLDFLNEHRNIKQLTNDEIVITKVGTPCFSSIIHNINQVALSRTVLGLKNICGIHPYYLMAFLRSKYGFYQLYRERELTIQYQLTLERVANILIYKPKQERIEQTISQLCHQYIKAVCQFQDLCKQAEQIIFDELNIHGSPNVSRKFIKNHSVTKKAQRLDAEYFQPQYDDLLEIYKKFDHDSLENLCDLIGHPSNPPYATEKEEHKTFVVTQRHLGEYFLNDEFWNDEEALYTTDDFLKKNEKYIVQKEDILLYSVGAYIGKANIYTASIKATIGSFLTLLRAKKERINPYYLLVWLNSDIGISTSKRHQRGMAQQYLYPYDIKTFIIPLIDMTKQDEIERLLLTSYTNLINSKALIDIAKKGIEFSIEQNEQIAEAWIDEQLQRLQISV